MRTATSPDGIRWTPGEKLPIADFVEFASFYRHGGLYVVNAHTCSPWQFSEGGTPRGPQGVAWVSPDFKTWLPESAESFLLPEPAPAKRGLRGEYPQVHLGVGATSFGNVLVGLYGLWHNHPDFGKISCDLGLVVSSDGLVFREPVPGHVWMSADVSPVTQFPGKQHSTVLCQANGILNVGDETRIYYGRWRNTGLLKPEDVEQYYAEVALATLPRDRWGALGLQPNATEGSVWSAPVTLAKEVAQIALNADGAAGMRVELADANFQLLPHYSGANSGKAEGSDALRSVVSWPKGSLAPVAGRPVRLRIQLRKEGELNPRLYAVYSGSGT